MSARAAYRRVVPNILAPAKELLWDEVRAYRMTITAFLLKYHL